MIIAGIGSRNITKNESLKIKDFCNIFFKRYPFAWIRSGHASGSDIAFEKFSNGRCIAYLPFENFNNSAKFYTRMKVELSKIDFSIKRKAFESVMELHPNSKGLSDIQIKFHMRNYMQICGSTRLSKNVDAVIFCAEENLNGDVKGGTGQTIRVAKRLNIPCYNIRKDEHLLFLRN